MTVSHRTKTGCKYHVTEHALQLSVTMAGRKRHGTRTSEKDLSTASSSSSATGTKKDKCQITVSTLEKWQQKYDKEHQTLSWLKCEKDKANKSLVALLLCSVYREYQLSGSSEPVMYWITPTPSSTKKPWLSSAPHRRGQVARQ